MAVDNHPPFLETLNRRIQGAGLENRVSVVLGDMFNLDFAAESFDVIWSEGAIYIRGFEKGLREWRQLLKAGGFIAVSELTWLKPFPPAQVKAFWHDSYPGHERH